jgi:serine/threonine-protein kinase HipA
LITREGVALAPFYDLVSTAIYRDLIDKLALKIGGENRPDWIQKRHWEGLAEISGANPRIVWQRIADIAESIPATSAKIALALGLEKNEATQTGKIIEVIAARAKHLRRHK